MPSNGNIFHVTGPLCREFTSHWWIPLTKVSDAELWCLLWSVPWINGSVSNRKAGDLRLHCTPYDIIVMFIYDKGKTWIRLWNQTNIPYVAVICKLHFALSKFGEIPCYILFNYLCWINLLSCLLTCIHWNDMSLKIVPIIHVIFLPFLFMLFWL